MIDTDGVLKLVIIAITAGVKARLLEDSVFLDKISDHCRVIEPDLDNRIKRVIDDKYEEIFDNKMSKQIDDAVDESLREAIREKMPFMVDASDIEDLDDYLKDWIEGVNVGLKVDR
jgi:hypothetical protein